MFNIQGSEIIIIVLVALIVLGPEKLPDAIRRFSKFYAEIRKMSSGFQSELRNALDEPMRELRDTADLVRKNADFRSMLDETAAPSSTTTSAPPVPDSSAEQAALPAAGTAGGPPTAPAPGLDPVNAAEQAAGAPTYGTAELAEPMDDAEAPGGSEPFDGPNTEPTATEADTTAETSDAVEAPDSSDPATETSAGEADRA